MKRLRLYFLYKSQQVAPDEIDYNDSDSAEENYKRLCFVRLRLCRCLQARREVFELYADDDAGHAAAIRFVENQLNEADRLLHEACQHMLKAAASKKKEAAEAAEAAADNKEEERQQSNDDLPPPPFASIAKTCQRLQHESEMLQAIADEGYERSVDAYKRMIHIVKTDPHITSDMRQMLLAAEQCETDELFAILQLISAQMLTAHRHSDTFQMTRCKRAQYNAYFYHTEVSNETLANAVYKFQTHLMPKRILVENAVGLSKRARQFAFYLFKAICSASGQFTTRESLHVVFVLADIFDTISDKIRRKFDVMNRKALCKTHGEEGVDKLENGIRYMITKCRGDTESWPEHTALPWTFFRRVLDGRFIQYCVLAAAVLVGDAAKPPFLYVL